MPAITHPELLNLPTQLQTERLTLRTWATDDGADLFAAVQRSQAHLRPWMPWVGSYKSVDDGEIYARKMQADWLARIQFAFQLRRRTDGHLVGAVGLHQPDWTVPSLMAGWWISADALGLGLASEAAAAVLQFGFEHLQAVRIWATCDDTNFASERVMQKIGMEKEGLHRLDGRTPEGKLRNTLFYAKLATPTSE